MESSRSLDRDLRLLILNGDGDLDPESWADLRQFWFNTGEAHREASGVDMDEVAGECKAWNVRVRGGCRVFSPPTPITNFCEGTSKLFMFLVTLSRL